MIGVREIPERAPPRRGPTGGSGAAAGRHDQVLETAPLTVRECHHVPVGVDSARSDPERQLHVEVACFHLREEGELVQ